MGYLRFTVRARFNRLRLSEKHAQDVFFFVCVCRECGLKCKMRFLYQIEMNKHFVACSE